MSTADGGHCFACGERINACFGYTLGRALLTGRFQRFCGRCASPLVSAWLGGSEVVQELDPGSPHACAMGYAGVGPLG